MQGFSFLLGLTCSFILAASAAGSIPNGPLSLNYSLHFVNTTTHPLAVCNDGTPAAYYLYTPPPKGASATNEWVFHQQGGWWCWDPYSCDRRWDHFANHTTELRTLMSTKDLEALTAEHDTFNGEKNTGLMAHDASNNPLAGARKVFLVYCSSDAHAGNRSATPVDDGADGRTPSGRGEPPASKWHFRGKAIVTAVIAELHALHGLGAADTFLLTGGSAGGMATINNADFVASEVRRLAPKVKGDRFLAMPDSGFFLDVAPFAMCQSPGTYECLCAAGPATAAAATTTTTMEDGSRWARPDGHSWLGRGQTVAQQAQAMLVFTAGVPDASCAMALGRFGAWRCYLGQYAAPHLSTRTLYLQSQIDEWQGFWNGFFDFATSALSFEYAQWFRSESARTLRDAATGGPTSTSSSPRVFVFAPNCYHHGLSYDARFWAIRSAGNWSAAEMLDALMKSSRGLAAPPPQLAIDACEGLPCSPHTAAGYPECRSSTAASS